MADCQLQYKHPRFFSREPRQGGKRAQTHCQFSDIDRRIHLQIMRYRLSSLTSAIEPECPKFCRDGLCISSKNMLRNSVIEHACLTVLRSYRGHSLDYQLLSIGIDFRLSEAVATRLFRAKLKKY